MIQNPIFVQFVETTYPALVVFIVRCVGNVEVAADIAQAAYAAMFQNPRFDPCHPGAFGFLRCKARWLVRDHRRRSSRNRERLSEELARGDEPGPERALEIEELRARVRGAVDELREQHREILLRHLQGMDHTEIAADLALPIQTVYNRFHQAKSALRQLLCSEEPLRPK